MGTECIIYVPEGEPERNGKIEAFNNTLQQEFISENKLAEQTIDEARKALAAFIHTYNTNRPHSSLQHEEPCKHGTYQQLDVKAPRTSKVKAERYGTLAYWRRIDGRGIAQNRVTSECYELDPHVAGNYCEIAINWATMEGTVTVDRKVIGKFNHKDSGTKVNGVRWIKVNLDPEAVELTSGPKRFDEEAYTRQMTKRLKRKVAEYPKGLAVKHTPDGCILLDAETGEIYAMPESLNADHLTDIDVFTEYL
ncbi:integrase core domain-containing protein [Candidatus Viridilinea mediisalina]|uniref:integrase core domain-containing protein n=1 Tax=Candidatus Viridilinea mediisalina TaxID=2024553 RepID=UPI0013FDE877|nr:integrase core domain-containing protein [Candidatus Viridilinea mediisalina]